VFYSTISEYFTISSMLFTDEARFSTYGIINVHNQHQWAEENPHGVIHSELQHQLSIIVWAGTVGNCFVGPQVLPHRLTDNYYRNFLFHDLPKLLKDVN
jgi:hypothetical protein